MRTSTRRGAVAAQAAERALLHERQHLGLRRRGQVADLVEEQRAAVGHLDQPQLALARVGERAALVPEQLALDQAVRESPHS